ncbi:uncharacterized protein LOC111829025 [Capsella rubella]|uniref:uncharacterized protein LOC111829025 n=1 Tax=Capsella rubella TaxID=81985 RepID=UPI000CD5AF58|nr:uncharacterized protein LOC111829025 [Capsella rubella]
MRRLSQQAVSVAAKEMVSRAKAARPVASTTTNQWYSTVPPPKEEDEEEDEMEEMEMIPFPSHIPGGGGLVVRKKNKKMLETPMGQNKPSSGQDSGQGQGTNVGEKPDYGGGCSGCPGCTRCGCPGCDGGCNFCFGCDACKYKY